MTRIKVFSELDSQTAKPEFSIKERYNKTTKDFKKSYNLVGCYALYNGEKATRPAYVGCSSSNLGKTITRHFQRWNAKESKFVVTDKKKLSKMYVEFYPMSQKAGESDTDFRDRISLEESKLIEKLNPLSNLYKYAHKGDPEKYLPLEKRETYIQQMQILEKEYEEAEREFLRRDIEEAEAERKAIEAEAKAREQARKQAQKAAGIETDPNNFFF